MPPDIIVGGGATQTPPSSTLSQLMTDVLGYVGLPDHTEAQTLAIREINKAIGELNRRNWYWALTYTDLTMIADTADYSLPANFSSARMGHWLGPTGIPCGKVSWMDPKTFDEYAQYGGSGTPRLYTVYNFGDNPVLSFDVPVAAGTITSYASLRLRYFARVPPLSNASDTLPIPSEAEGFIVWKARKVLCLSTDPDGNRMAAASREADIAWQMLVNKDNSNNFNDWE